MEMSKQDGFDRRSVLTITLVYDGDEFDRVIRSADALLVKFKVSDYSELFKMLVNDANNKR